MDYFLESQNSKIFSVHTHTNRIDPIGVTLERMDFFLGGQIILLDGLVEATRQKMVSISYTIVSGILQSVVDAVERDMLEGGATIPENGDALLRPNLIRLHIS